MMVADLFLLNALTTSRLNCPFQNHERACSGQQGLHILYMYLTCEIRSPEIYTVKAEVIQWCAGLSGTADRGLVCWMYRPALSVDR
jgi:hypothetical protein